MNDNVMVVVSVDLCIYFVVVRVLLLFEAVRECPFLRNRGKGTWNPIF